MKVLDIKTPEHLAGMLQGLQLTPADMKTLNRKLANQTRKYFRGQIRNQTDIDGKKYAPPKRRTATIDKTGKAKVNRNMLSGLSRMLIAQSDENGFSVGLAGLAGKIAKTHNEGETVSFTKRMNGWFDSKTNQWKGGTKQKAAYKMPKRTFIGWNKELELQIANEIMQHMEP